ncbi:hypothetical protein [Methanimicrococcus blatticola]|uniref:von Willebrand factor type A domain-containing protein n=1 Tax=Methanimicrococcus blatticola TaxID=91560 RepID=A0A484F8D8_9EURY|nr:hypothetical protein [Methanimicrococcus blatticola]MBZ3935056.1 hypothetical protein [Methanimicrococcus blatticola]MCC2508847.1 hypothetical protein [Methanimicrococcus blatticola]TDQ71126.1 hypothetical protein C7391_0226 [Methanimicrococcus blatticola]
MYFEMPMLLLLIIPAVLIGIYFFKKALGNKQKLLVGSRTVIAIILIIALANPVSFMTVTRTDVNPDMVLVVDNTPSMNYFGKGAGQELYDYFSDKFQLKYDTLGGNSTALGEKVAQYADGKNQIILVSDGNSNYGKTLEEGIDVAVQTNTTVSAVIPALERNDLSIEISGDKSVIYSNVQEFGITVRQAGTGDVTYNYVVKQNNNTILNETFTMTDGEQEKTTYFQTRFMYLGTHTLEATLTSSADTDPINNVFKKSIYAIEKPDVIVVTSESNASLTQVAGSLYNVTVVKTLSEFGDRLPDALASSKTVIIDDMYIGNMTEEEVAYLKEYVSEGGGLMVVGGKTSFDYPVGHSYLDSSFEKLLPVVSVPSDWEGIQDVYLFIDVSDSASTWGANNETLLSNIKKSAVNIIESDYFKEANITYFTIGDQSRNDTGEFYFVGNPRESEALKKEIEDLKTGDGQTDLVHTFDRAIPVMENRSGQPLVIIISDGNLLNQRTYNELLRSVNQADKYGASMLFMNIYTGGSKRPNQFNDSRGNIYAKSLMRNYKGDGVYVESNQGLPIYPNFTQMFGEVENPNENVTEASLYISNPKHFIVQGLNISGTNISGYNGVTPKAGSDKLIIASDGSPVLTVWRYGLGRVAALTTDNGVGNGNYWASELYAAPGSKVISATTNWVMGDPNKESGLVIDCPDTYVGQPVTLRVNMYDAGIPVLMLNDQKLLLTMESEGVYVTELTFNQTGTYNISGYPVTVNYPLEYRNIGVYQDFRKLIESTGGNIYTVEQAKALYIKNNGDKTTYQTREAVSFNVYLLLLALVIFLAEVIYRRVTEIKELKRLHEEYDKREKESPGAPPPRPDMSQFRRQNDMVADAKGDAKKFLAKMKDKTKKNK